jgi:hypothetical protein
MVTRTTAACRCRDPTRHPDRHCGTKPTVDPLPGTGLDERSHAGRCVVAADLSRSLHA